MNYFQDFDQEENYEDNKNTKKNTFVFESFNDRLKKIKVRLSNNLTNDVSFLKIEKEENFTMLDNESNFLTLLNREKVLNSSPEFGQFVKEIKPFTSSFLILINNSQKLINIFSDNLDKHLNIKLDADSESAETLNKFNENALNQRNYPFITSVLEVMTGFIKDIREEAAEIFLTAILPNLVKLLCNSNNTVVIDKTFSVFVNIFKFLSKAITKNFRKFFLTISELVFNKNKLIRKFSSESVCFLFKNMEKNELGKCLSEIFEVFIKPEIIFNIDESRIQENVDMNNSSSNFNDLFLSLKSHPYKTSSDFLKSLLIRSVSSNCKSEKEKLYLFLIDCLSDLLCEILLGMNKSLSVRADLIMENIIECFEEESIEIDEKDSSYNKDKEYLCFIRNLILLDTYVKLFHILAQNNKKNAITLFHFFIHLIENKGDTSKTTKVTFPKLNLETLSVQLNKCTSDNLSERSQIYCLIYIREMILKNYNRLNIQLVNYFLEFFEKIVTMSSKEKDNSNPVRNMFISEIFCLFVKFFPKELSSFYKIRNHHSSIIEEDKSRILKIFSLIFNKTDLKGDSIMNSLLLQNFLNNLKSLQRFESVLEMIFLNKRKLFNTILNSNNEDYELNHKNYDHEIVTFVFETLLNELKFSNSTQILDTVTTYKFLSLNNHYRSEEDNSKYHTNLNLYNLDSKKIVIEDLKNYSGFVTLQENFDLDKFVEIHSRIILFSLLKEDNLKEIAGFSSSIFNSLIDSLQFNENDEKFIKLTEDHKEKKLFSILLNEFNSEGVYFISKREAILILLENFISINESFSNYGSLSVDLIKKLVTIIFNLKYSEYLNVGVIFQILNKILSENFQGKVTDFIEEFSLDNYLSDMTSFISEHSVILLSHNNIFKLEYLNFIQSFYFTHLTNDGSLKEIFEIMQNILELRVDQNNEKKFAFDFEVLMSKTESILAKNIQDKWLSKNFSFVLFNFLLGSYWIRYTKTVWSVITKSLDKIFSMINTYELSEVKEKINESIKIIISFIRNVGTNDDLITRYGVNSNIIKSNYLKFLMSDRIKEDVNSIYMENIISFNFLLKQDELATINLFYEGFLQSLQGYHLLLETRAKLREDESMVLNFLKFLIDNLNFYCNEQENWLDQIMKESDLNTSPYSESSEYILCIFNNYVSDKEHKTGPLHKKLVESLFMILSKMNFSDFSKNLLISADIKKILYKTIITSKSLKIQKFCVDILIMLDDRLKNYKKLLEAVIDNTNVIDRLYNIERITNDNGLDMKPEEREALIPIVTRLYYSKYFYVSNENKKMRTKNKINLVSFFIQLNRNEFIEYTRIMFEPISIFFNQNNLPQFDFDSILFGSDLNLLDRMIEEGFSSFNYNIKTFRKLIEILILNIKQITNLFQDSIYFVSILLKKILVFIKKLNSFIKNHLKTNLSEFFEIFEGTLQTTNINKTKYYNYYNNEGISQYLKFYTKNIKEIKKQIFGLLKNIFSKFYHKQEMISKITYEICQEYKYVLDEIRSNHDDNQECFKINSIINFFMSFAKNPHLHFVYINNNYMFCSILEIFKQKTIQNYTLKILLEFVDFILSPYHNIKIQVAREEYIKTWKENIEKGRILDEGAQVGDVEMKIDPENENEEIIAQDEDQSRDEDNSVKIEELNMNEFDDDKEDESLKNLNHLTEEVAKFNEDQLIIKNFGVFNENLLYLVKNKKVKYTVKDWNTRKMIEIFVYLWNMYQSSIETDFRAQSSSLQLMVFLLNLLKNDSKIYKYKTRETLCDILKVCHVLILINKTEKNKYFKDLLSLIYKISEEDSNNRLILSILLQEFDDYYGQDNESEKSKLKEIFQLISNLNLSTRGIKAIAKKRIMHSLDKHEGNSNLDVDNTLDRLNILEENFLSKFELYHLEPLIYMLLVFSKNLDYSLQTISISKIKMIFEIYQIHSNKNLKNLLDDLVENEKMSDVGFSETQLSRNYNRTAFYSILNAFYELLEGGQKNKSNSNTNLARTILEILSHINSLIFSASKNLLISDKKFEIICTDLYSIKLKNYDYNFLEGILNLKYDIRSDGLRSLREKLENKTINYFSLTHIVVPITKTFLTPNTFIQSNSYSNEKHIESLISETIECIPGICGMLKIKDLKDFLFFFFNQIERSNKKSSDNEKQAKVEEIMTRMLYKGLTKLIETLTKIIKCNFEFDKEFLKYSDELMEEHIVINKNNFDKTGNSFEKPEVNNALNYNKEYFKRLFEKLSSKFKTNFKEESEHKIEHEHSISKYEIDESWDILKFIKSKVYKTLKSIVTDSPKKEKNKQYYLRNYAIRPYIEVLKFLDPYQIKYELIQLNYEIINNLKNRDLAAREKSREAIKILFDSLGCQIAPMIFDELKTQLHSGYQRYIMGYTCNFMINIINNNYSETSSRLVFDFSLNLILPILIEELFGEVAEEKEIEELVKKYKEAKQTKAFNSFFVLGSKIHLPNAIVELVYPIRSYLLKRENDTATVNKANEVINHIIKGFKINNTMNFDEILNYSYGLIINGIEINLKNSKEIKENRKVTIKGGEVNDSKLKRKTYQQQVNEAFTIQVGAMNGKNYSMEIAEKLIDNKNEIVLSNLFTSLGLDLFHISLKKKMFDFKSIQADEKSDLSDRLSLLLSQIIICLKISNNNILSKSLKILTKLFDCRLFVIKKNLNKIVSSLFKNLNMINSQDMNIAQAILSSIGEILTRFKFYEITDNQLNILISFLKLNIHSVQIKPYVFSCLLSLIKRKILHPLIYDMIKYIQEIYITAFEENTITLCQNIILEFLKGYPLENAALLSHINYYVINLESPTRKCIINSLKILYKFFDQSENNQYDSKVNKNESNIKEKLDAIVDFVFIKLITLITNTDDPDIKSLIFSNIDIIVDYLDKKDKNKLENYMNKIIKWMEVEQTEKSMIKLSLNLFSEIRIGQLVTAKYQALFGTTTYSKRRVMAGIVVTKYI